MEEEEEAGSRGVTPNIHRFRMPGVLPAGSGSSGVCMLTIHDDPEMDWPSIPIPELFFFFPPFF